jgi:hypothetical protein
MAMRAPVDLDLVVGQSVALNRRWTDHDLARLITHLRLLDADADTADWREAARLIPSHRSASRAGSRAVRIR